MGKDKRKSPEAFEEIERNGNLVTMSLPCTLTKDEIAGYGTRAGEVKQVLNDIAAKKEKYVHECKLEAEPLEAELDTLLDKLGDGEELRQVKCELVYDLEANMACYRRLDTGDVGHTRAIRTEELEAARQGKLNLGDQQ